MLVEEKPTSTGNRKGRLMQVLSQWAPLPEPLCGLLSEVRAGGKKGGVKESGTCQRFWKIHRGYTQPPCVSDARCL
jgi:hypothetical protein